MYSQNKVFEILKSFDNEGEIPDNPFKDKWVSIIGDYTSVYDGWDWEHHLDDSIEKDPIVPNEEITDPSMMWWHKLLSKLGAKLCVNNSYQEQIIWNSVSTLIAKFIIMFL